jgi:ribosomal protein S18 acetylase RimI-like enzyme
MHLRPYRPEDWPCLCQIHDAARRDELASSALAAAFLTLEQTAEGGGLFDGTVIVAEDEGEVRGFAAFTADELTWLYVDPTQYRKGVGRALLRQAIAGAGATMKVEVLVGNQAALALYLSEGFRIVKRVDGRFTGNEGFAASGYVLERTTKS